MKIRCPYYAGIGVFIDRFNHLRFYDCPICKGRKRIEIVRVDTIVKEKNEK